MSSNSHVIVLTGAPEKASLSWDETALTAGLLPVFSVSHGRSQPEEYQRRPVPPRELPSWRYLSIYQQYLHTGLTPSSQPQLIPWEFNLETDDRNELGASFLSTDSLTSQPYEPNTLYVEDSFSSHTTVDIEGSHGDAGRLIRFLSHSFAIHDTLSSSQLPLDGSHSSHLTVPNSPDQKTASFVSTAISTAKGSTPICSPSSPKPLPFPYNMALTKACGLPNAKYIRDLQPQTLTVNMVAAVLAVALPKNIRPRRAPHRPVQLLELTVGDDTRSGLGINLWLPVPDIESSEKPRWVKQPSAAEEEFAETSRKLRPRDVVLFRNIAMGEWRDMVYGQSLRSGLTQVYLLCRELVDVYDESGIWNTSGMEDAQLNTHGSLNPKKDDPRDANEVFARAGKVREWMHNFVGPGFSVGDAVLGQHSGQGSITVRGKREPRDLSERQQKRARVLPPDTQ